MFFLFQLSVIYLKKRKDNGWEGGKSLITEIISVDFLLGKSLHLLVLSFTECKSSNVNPTSTSRIGFEMVSRCYLSWGVFVQSKKTCKWWKSCWKWQMMSNLSIIKIVYFFPIFSFVMLSIFIIVFSGLSSSDIFFL